MVWDVLTFQVYISPDLLILVYYTGALGIPLLVWKVTGKAKARLASLDLPEVELQQNNVYPWIPTRGKLVIFSVAGLVMMEVFWRVFFEFMLAYFQIRDYLAAMQTH